MQNLLQHSVLKRIFSNLNVPEPRHDDVFRAFASGLIEVLESPSQPQIRARIRTVRHR